MDDVIVEEPSVLARSEKRLYRALDLLEISLKAKTEETNRTNVKLRESLSERIKMTHHQASLEEQIQKLESQLSATTQKNNELEAELQKTQQSYDVLKKQGKKTLESLDEAIDDLFTLTQKEGENHAGS